MPHVVALALSEGVPIFELAAPCAIFGTDRSAVTGTDWYEFQICGPTSQTRVDSWLTASSSHTYADLKVADTVIVPACHDEVLDPPPELVDAVRTAYENGARIVSICTGAFVLAAAGLLDGRRATTHWRHANALATRVPRATVDPHPLYIEDDRVFTSAGKSAGTDLCLHLVRTDYGASAANQIARILVAPPHRDGAQSQYIAPPALVTASDSLAETTEWVVAHLDDPITIDEIARHAGVSARTLHRHFTSRFGTGPLEWLNRQRIHRAQELLESTSHSIEQIATRSGFGTAVALRRNFRSALATTPDAYRRTFAAS